MAATRADLRARAVEFTSTADATVDLALADALSQINTTNWGTSKADLGQIYYACHLLKIWGNGSSAAPGPVNKRKDGDLEEGYAIASSVEDEILRSTIWGKLYIDLRDTVFSARVM